MSIYSKLQDKVPDAPNPHVLEPVQEEEVPTVEGESDYEAKK